MVPIGAASGGLPAAGVLCRELASISWTSTPERACSLRRGSAAGLPAGSRTGFSPRQDPEGLPWSDGPREICLFQTSKISTPTGESPITGRLFFFLNLPQGSVLVVIGKDLVLRILFHSIPTCPILSHPTLCCTFHSVPFPSVL